MARRSSRFRGGRWLAGVALLVVLAGCQEGDPFDEASEFVPEETTTTAEQTTTTAQRTTTTTEDPHGAPGWDGDVDQLSNGQNVSGDIARVRRDIPFETAVAAGRRITVTFPGGDPGTADSLCNVDHRVTIDEQESVVALSVTQILTLVPDAAIRDCPIDDQQWALTNQLAAPLGNRQLVDLVAGSSLLVAEEEARLVPTWLPEGWVTLRDDELMPLRTLRYVSPEGQVLVFQSAPITAGYRLSDHKRDPWWEPTTIRNQDDGVFLSLDDRRTNVTFEEQGWYYKVNSTADVDPSIVLNFVRSFERPNLVVGGVDPRLTAREILDPQPGQEEREAQAVQGQ